MNNRKLTVTPVTRDVAFNAFIGDTEAIRLILGNLVIDSVGWLGNYTDGKSDPSVAICNSVVLLGDKMASFKSIPKLHELGFTFVERQFIRNLFPRYMRIASHVDSNPLCYNINTKNSSSVIASALRSFCVGNTITNYTSVDYFRQLCYRTSVGKFEIA
jgi:hypothetical protein